MQVQYVIAAVLRGHSNSNTIIDVSSSNVLQRTETLKLRLKDLFCLLLSTEGYFLNFLLNRQRHKFEVTGLTAGHATSCITFSC